MLNFRLTKSYLPPTTCVIKYTQLYNYTWSFRYKYTGWKHDLLNMVLCSKIMIVECSMILILIIKYISFVEINTLYLTKKILKSSMYYTFIQAHYLWLLSDMITLWFITTATVMHPIVTLNNFPRSPFLFPHTPYIYIWTDSWHTQMYDILSHW